MLKRYLKNMEPFIRAILESDLPKVRSLIANDPKLAHTGTESGKTPVQLAYGAENYPVTAILLKNTPRCIDEIPVSPPDILRELIGDFSQATLCSGWNQNIEFDLWALVIADQNYQRNYDSYLAVDSEALNDIGWISSWAEGWFHWPDSEESPRFVGINEWQALYQERTRR